MARAKEQSSSSVKTRGTIKQRVKAIKLEPVTPKTSYEIERENVRLNKIADTTLTNLVDTITQKLGLDQEAMDKRIYSAKSSKNEYGSINAMINLIVKIAEWPVDQGDASMLATNRRILEKDLGLNLMLLEDIKRYRGFHSFVSSDVQIIDGVEPDYEKYGIYCRIFLEDLGAETTRPTISEAVWRATEMKAAKEAKEELLRLQTAVANHNATMEAHMQRAREARLNA